MCEQRTMAQWPAMFRQSSLSTGGSVSKNRRPAPDETSRGEPRLRKEIRAVGGRAPASLTRYPHRRPMPGHRNSHSLSIFFASYYTIRNSIGFHRDCDLVPPIVSQRKQRSLVIVRTCGTASCTRNEVY